MSAPLWTAAQAAAATGGRAIGDWAASGVAFDSRQVVPGDLFLALPGEHADGHAFVAEALRRGAAAALVARRPADLPPEAPLLLVADTMAGFYALAVAARARSRARVAAVTGSVGKTGSKEMLRLALGALGPTHASYGNLNNQVGAPLSLARLPADAQWAVLELGMNHPGEIRPLSRLVRPHAALVTNVQPVHLGHFPSLEAIADAKSEIFEGVEADGAAVLNRDDAMWDRLVAAARTTGIRRVIGFGESAEAEVRLLEEDLGETASRVVALVAGRPVRYEVGAPGRHWVRNSLGVLAAVHALGGDTARAATALAEARAPKGRGARTTLHFASGGTAELIDESYNASPPAVAAALAVLGRVAPAPGGRRIAVLGDMLELGEAAPALHEGLAAEVEAAGVDLVFAVGPNMARLVDRLPSRRVAGRAPAAADLADRVAAALRPGDVLMVKGSLGMRMATIVDAVRALDTGTPRRVVNGR